MKWFVSVTYREPKNGKVCGRDYFAVGHVSGVLSDIELMFGPDLISAKVRTASSQEES